MPQRYWIIYYCCCLHLVWGLILLFNTSALNITAIHSMTSFFGLDNHIALGIVCILFGIAAFVGAFERFKNTSLGLAMMTPQQFILMESAIGAIMAISHSCFADGVIRDRAFIGADQAPAILVALFHTCAIIDFHLKDVIYFWTRRFRK